MQEYVRIGHTKHIILRYIVEYTAILIIEKLRNQTLGNEKQTQNQQMTRSPHLPKKSSGNGSSRRVLVFWVVQLALLRSLTHRVESLRRSDVVCCCLQWRLPSLA